MHAYPRARRILNITVAVKNKGDTAETFDVNAYHNNNSVGTLTVTDLDSGEEANVTFGWNTECLQPCVSYTIKAEASEVPSETNITDNIYIDGTVKIIILGDANGDGIVDIHDVVKAGLALGSYLGHPRWNPDADLIEDGIVDIFDMVTMALHFGETC